MQDLKNKVYYPIYFLMGEEPYFIDMITNYIIDNVLNEDEKEFNLTVKYGIDVDIPSIISQAKQFPMMANYQIIVIKEAQNIHQDKIELLQECLNNPIKSTILVICYKYKTIDARKKFYKDLVKKAVVFESKAVQEKNIPNLIINFAKQRHLNIQQEAAYLLFEYLGTDLSKIANELDKLTIILPPKSEITIKNIEEYIGISKGFTVFELQKALGKKDIVKANTIINYFDANPKDNPFMVIIANLYSYFSKILIIHYTPDKSEKNIASVLHIPPFYVYEYINAAKKFNITKTEKIISLLREYDAKAKGIDNDSIDEGELLKELIFKILHF
jgi:DNA polymerase-3 subunit delta